MPASRLAEGAFGRLFYAEGDYVHDMDLGFYEAYQYSGGENWKSTASYPPLIYPTHSIGGVLGAWQTHAVQRRPRSVSSTSAATASSTRRSASSATTSPTPRALFEVAGGGAFRTNEFRRVGYPSHIRESRFRFFGTEAQLGAVGHGEPVAGQARASRTSPTT